MSEVNPGRYRHYKGNKYTVIGTARHSETLEEMVVYHQEYGEHGLWVRPKEMFLEMVRRRARLASVSTLGFEQREHRRERDQHL